MKQRTQVNSINSNLVKYLFNYTIVLLCKPMELSIVKQTSRIILCVWLMASVVISIEFTSYLMDKLIRSLPSASIDTIDQIFNQDKLKVVTRSDGPLATYAENIGDKAIDRLILYDEYNTVAPYLTSGLMNGSLAFSNNRLSLILGLIKMNEFYKSNSSSNGPQLIDVILISDGSLGFEPYFAFINGESNSWIASAIDNVYVIDQAWPQGIKRRGSRLISADFSPGGSGVNFYDAIRKSCFLS